MSKKKEITITNDEWIAEVFHVQKKPPGSFTTDEIIKKTGINRSTLTNRLLKMVDSGELIRGKFVSNGRIANYYIPVKKKK